MNIEEYLSHFDKFTKDPTLEAMEWIMDKFDKIKEITGEQVELNASRQN